MDASESAFFSQQLTHIRAAAFEVLYPELKGRMIVPKSSDAVHPGAEKYEYRYFTETGKAIISRDYATDAPRADLHGTSADSTIVGLRNSYGYSIQEARAAQMAGLPLDARKARAARNVLETLVDTLIWAGDSDTGLAGFAALSDTCTYTTPVGDAGLKTFESKTPDEIIIDLMGMVTQIHSDTNDVESPNAMVLPSTSYDHVASRRMGDGSDTTVLKHFLAINGAITSVERSVKLETAGTASSKRMIAYNKSNDKVAVIVPQEFEQFPPQQKALEVVTECHMRYGGVVAYYPKSVCYGDYI
jgi:hypothetical protein